MPGVILEFFPPAATVGEIQRLQAARRKQIIKIAAADKHDRHGRRPHQRHGEKHESDHRRDLVTERIGVGRRINTQWNRDQIDDEKIDQTFNLIVTGSRSAILSQTGWLSLNESPNSSVKIFCKPDEILNVQRFVEAVLRTPLGHRLVDGAALFKGNAGAAGRASPPAARSSAGSPGARRMIRKPIKVMPINVGIISSRRWPSSLS